MIVAVFALCAGFGAAQPCCAIPAPVAMAADTTPRRAPKRRAPAPDAWFGEDKFKHGILSFLATSLAASGARAAGLHQRASLWTGAAAGVGAGVWKELRDRNTPGATPSLRDLVWDAAGVGAGAAIGGWGR